MTDETILANAKILLFDEVVTGAVVVRDGRVHDIDPGAGILRGALDCGGDFLAPGLVELHTDNLERHMRPRPHVYWPHQAAIMAHDAELASVGITTVFDALRIGSLTNETGKDYRPYARNVATEILDLRAKNALKISHMLHLRAEICSETLTEELAAFGPGDRVRIVSLMDHTPGQRQFSDLSKYVAYQKGKYGMSDADVAAHMAYLSDLRARLGDSQERAAVAAAKRFGATLASHDDSTAKQVAVSHSHGVTVAEFPTTLEAAKTCHNNAIGVIMGAPNLVRGGSHSGNVAAGDLAEAGLLDILSSDYVPASLLLGAVQLGRLWGDMARGLASVTAAPARATGLADRGEIAVGKRADLIRFTVIGDTPGLRGVWVQGARV